MMRASALKAPKDDLREEVSELRTELERLAGELEEMRSHAATLESLALEDPLTGLLNRRGFMRDLSRAIAYRARYDTPIALLMSDLDRFKPINDTYGHEVGDRALEHLAGLLRSNIRSSDCLGRLGGDEFALILWQVDEDTARAKAASLRAMVAGTPLQVAGLTLTLSTSIGVAALEAADTPEQALMRADQAMYRQKAERRERRA
jgi:diguanylate cyclase (GGDEF)-like protein